MEIPGKFQRICFCRWMLLPACCVAVNLQFFVLFYKFVQVFVTFPLVPVFDGVDGYFKYGYSAGWVV
jgi:hypothetical protein